jgi:hypothetical protein
MGKTFIFEERLNKRLVSIQVHIEMRNNVRFSFGKDKLIFRIPNYFDSTAKNTSYKNGLKWAEKAINKKPHLLNRIAGKDYTGILQYKLMDIEWKLSISYADNSKIKHSFYSNQLLLQLPNEYLNSSKLIPKILSKIFAKKYKNNLIEEVNYINQQYFNKEISNIRLKYNSSNWGSCSSKGNLNFSTRVLLLPKSVREYVIIHEMCHLIQMNHSDKFWKEVAKRCRDYKKAELFLNNQAGPLDF